ncbi:hypothetical protein DV735_g3031, partial [Chaetothyriales sp. CBS 134920]
MRIFILLLALVGISAAAGPKKECMYSVTSALGYLTFSSAISQGYYESACTNRDVVISTWAGSKLYCTPEDIKQGEELLGGYCSKYGEVTLIPYSEIEPMLTDSFISSLPVVSYEDIEKGTLLEGPVLVSKEFHTTAMMTDYVFTLEYYLHELYGWGIYGFWGGILLIGMVNNLLTHIFTSRRLKAAIDVEGRKSLAHLRGKMLWSTIPTRLETIVVLGFWALIILLSSVRYIVFLPNLYYTIAQQYWRYTADRTGILSYACLAWIWMFSGRNNIFIWLTGWQFSTFNIFHRHVARGATMLAIVHSINCHTTFIFDQEYDPYIWAPIGIWIIDRLARVGRWVYCNIHVKSSGILNSKASATYVKEADFIRVEVTPGSQHLHAGPGQHYYLYQPMAWRGWENHPFTLGGTSRAANGQTKLTFFVRPFDGWTKRLRDQCLKSATGTITPHIFIEGPYGEHSPLHAFENVVFIVGGSGIAGALPYLQEHLRLKSENATLTQNITMVWTAKQAAMIRDIAAKELKPMLDCDDIQMQLHATTKRGGFTRLKDKVSGKGGDEKDTNTSSSSSSEDELAIQPHRPNIRHTILSVIKEVNNAGSAGGRIAILTCGPGGMADEARAAVHAAMKQGMRGVEYFEEAFGW